MNSQARAILWAQTRSLWNYMPRARKSGLVFSIVISALWYGVCVFLAVMAAKVVSDPGDPRLARTVLSGGLLLAFLYWQVIPVLTAAMGASLEIGKLVVYPIPHAQLFGIDLLLRVTTGVEVLIVLAGAAVGLAMNPATGWWAPLVLVPFIVFNLSCAAGTREIVTRLFARKRARELAVFLLVLCGALPQLFMSLGENEKYRGWFRNWPQWWSSPGVTEALTGALPWSAATGAALGENSGVSILVLLAWTGMGYAFGRWQFERGLRFDADAARATTETKENSPSLLDGLYRWPSRLFPDPLAALIEKEIRFLSRAPRFRLVFTMGFTFGLVIWLPIAGRGGEGFLARNFLTLVSLYALLLLGDVCFWNMFGFDRRAVQIYLVAPVKFATVILAKNITALFFVLLEITLIIVACSILRMPVTAARLAEAYAVTLVITLYLVAVGNLTSTYHPRGVNPVKSMRRGSAGGLQALFVLVYPVAGIPVALAYAARYAFGSSAAFYGVLGITAAIGAIVYWVALESAVEAAVARREEIVDRLLQGEGPIGA